LREIANSKSCYKRAYYNFTTESLGVSCDLSSLCALSEVADFQEAHAKT
jgi:hypothetical protein